MNTEQQKSIAMVEGIQDQIEKRHWLNVHFRAFELANEAWKEHVRANARLGAERANSPPGAVLDSDRESKEPRDAN